MRDIVFRGKAVDSGEWVYGIPASFRKIDNVVRATMILEIIGEHVMSQCVCVDPDTVGQFTGLRDKKGVRIFEGDIIRHGRKGELWEIRWIEEYSRFAAWKPGTAFAVFAFGMGEVVGNVHDNPDMMGGAAKHGG